MIYAICGLAGSGKDTFGRMLRDESPGCTKGMSFAMPMKHMLDTLGIFSTEALFGPSEARNEESEIIPGLTARHALQTLGTEWGRALHPEFWIRIALRDAKSFEEDGCTVVFTDLRYLNEANAVREAGGVIIRVERDGTGLQGAAGAHASEQEGRLIVPNHVVENNGTLADLRARAREILGLSPDE